MSSAHQYVEEGYAALADTPPKGLSQVQISAWTLGYLFAYTGKPCPAEIQVTYDATLGYVYEVTNEDDTKEGFLVHMHKGRFIPTRLYSR